MDELKPGVYESLITRLLAQRIDAAGPALVSTETAVDPAEAHERLARHVGDHLRAVLYRLQREDPDNRAAILDDQIALCNLTLETIDTLAEAESRGAGSVAPPARLLRSLHRRGLGSQPPAQPRIPLRTSALILNEREHITMASALRSEIASCESVDLICAFVNFHGVRVLADAIADLLKRRGRFRLVTTTYMGATQRRALDHLFGLGAEIRVAYETPPARTKLHAKAWLFRRGNGLDTAFIGSSNLSHTALMDGLEWNVRLAEQDTPHVLRHFATAFDRYWTDPAFEPYDPEKDGDRLDHALGAGQSSGAPTPIAIMDVRPYPFQAEILEAIAAERSELGRKRSLVVAATGTGKTVIAALDYRRLAREHGAISLLFVAHRKEILSQALSTFRAVLRDGAFGEEWVDGKRPTEYRHVFASIQSLSRASLSDIPADHFRMVIVDEFHRAEATTYRRLLTHVEPEYLLGLTATPERMDGVDVADYFGGSTVEMRLWDALDEGILAPFQYFARADNVDLSEVSWEGGRYDPKQLERLYVGEGENRAALVLTRVRDIVTDPLRMRALGFCATVKHAEFMAEQFNSAGIPSAALSAQSRATDRARALQQLRLGTINALFAVDLFNEGLDIPEVDTVLFLRPTESATVFLQQLGRGLRLCEGKSCLTAIDFVGHHHRRFRFDLRLRAMTGLSRSRIEAQVDAGFTDLPAGCHIDMDRVSRDCVLENLRQSLPSNTPELCKEVGRYLELDPSCSLSGFLRETGLEPEDLYRGDRTLLKLRRMVGDVPGERSTSELTVSRAAYRLITVTDHDRNRQFADWLRMPRPPPLDGCTEHDRRLLRMLVHTLGLRDASTELESRLEHLWGEDRLRSELAELLDLVSLRQLFSTEAIGAPSMRDVPLRMHAYYTVHDVLLALGEEGRVSFREGVRYSRQHECDALFVTLRKSEADYSPTTMYDDRFISRWEFHWESQNATSPTSPVGQRYISNRGTVLLFVREAARQDGRTAPYFCTGPARYVSHSGEKPMQIVWELEQPVPAAVYPALEAAAG